MAALTRKRPGCARFVGGCVRNVLLDAPVSDLDIATQLRPEETVEALKAAGIKAIPTGFEHGTITAVCEGVPYEITSLRRDVETDGRRAVVAFTDDWAEDAQRRDFRMNALYADEEGWVYDPTGGIADIYARRVVFIGDADTRLREDHLRNLRFFRFSSWYADDIDPDGLAACGRLKDGLNQIAAERIWKELGKLLEAPNPVAALEAMFEAGVLQIILPEADSLEGIRALMKIEAHGGTSFDKFKRLQSILPRNSETVSLIADRLRFSNAEAERLALWAKAEPYPKGADDIREWLYSMPVQTGRDMVVWSWAMDRDSQSDWGWQNAHDVAKGWPRPVFPLKGADLLKAGMMPGPSIGEHLKDIEVRWVENGFRFEGLVDEFTDPQIRSALQSLR